MQNHDLKISFFSPNLEGGGAERVISNLAIEFSKNGYDVDLVLTKAQGAYLNNIPDCVNVIDFQCGKVVFSLPKLIRYIQKEQPKIMFASQMHASTILIWAVKIARVNTKIIIRQPTMLYSLHEKKSTFSSIRQKLFLLTARYANQIIVTSKNMAEEFHRFSRLPENKIKIIYNPLPIETIKEKSLMPIDNFLNISDEIPIILAVGRLVKVKDFHTLVKAFYLVQKKVPAYLFILGDGELKLELKKFIQDLGLDNKVKILGFKQNPYNYMKNSKVFVLSSLREGFPNSMVEAMACGCSIVATDCTGGTSEILEYGKWGKIVPVGDEVLMAEAILESLNTLPNPNIYERVQKFSINYIFSEYEKTFFEVLNFK